jgi:glyoxylase-like metal-dependent hydrolase (beta-lactamase superfamily II)
MPGGEVVHSADGFSIEAIAVGSLDNNVYLIVDDATGAGVIVDAADDTDAILGLIDSRGVTAIVTTHGHWDHHRSAPAVAAATGAPFLLHPADDHIAGNVTTESLGTGRLMIGETMATIIHTPGHTPGSVCVALDGAVITGDTLFPGGPGATHFAYGSFPTIIESITTELFSLPDDTRVLPGHGNGTTIGAERPSLDDWIRRGW